MDKSELAAHSTAASDIYHWPDEVPAAVSGGESYQTNLSHSMRLISARDPFLMTTNALAVTRSQTN
ncbi:hypothetical protein SAMD00023353_7600060 [Rosellinia necatrix]|uniref:Uncharacterized protein n=1 Tax=Rosellinia necatrix TaxID=77044 RepID=A0A1W2TUH8_ROSNE|nr:hypothetical protein SAMD00023353_7600060 [Rosellinia necatrix]